MTVTFTIENLEKMLVNSVEKVFSTMLDYPITFEKSDTGPEGGNKVVRPLVFKPEDIMIAGMVGFVGGINGMIYLYMQDKLAAKLTGLFLGMNEAEVVAEGSETVNDAIGELTNMIVGSFKNQLCDKGHQCRLTIPSIMRGSVLSIATTSMMQRYIFNFKVGGHPFIADLITKKDSSY